MLFLCARSPGLAIDDVIAALLLFLVALRRNSIHDPHLIDVIALYVLRMQIVLHNVAVLVPVFALILQVVIHAQQVRIMFLMRGNPVGCCLTTLVRRRYLVVCPHCDLNLTSMVDSLYLLLHCRIDKATNNWIEEVSLQMLISSLEQVDTLLLTKLFRVIVTVPVVDDVKVFGQEGRDLSISRALLFQSWTFIFPGPVMIPHRNVRDDVVIHRSVREVSLSMFRSLLLSQGTMASEAHGIFTWS
mmetsp:Transcript_50790/g.91234  ORF Transcript_50790/g.91234 Transcript_50790/m.91234 type:complete len:244 (+) Transcript_50790:461-1192(+)